MLRVILFHMPQIRNPARVIQDHTVRFCGGSDAPSQCLRRGEAGVCHGGRRGIASLGGFTARATAPFAVLSEQN